MLRQIIKLLVNIRVDINLNNKIETVEFNESINTKSNSNSFEQNRYEKNIKKNFASSIRQKLITEIFNLNDN